MLNFVVRRFVQLPLVLVGVSALIFAILQFIPPDVRATSYITNEKQLAQLPLIVEKYGLDRDVFTQYGLWLGNVARGNLGWSTAAKQPVAQALVERLPATLELALIAIVPIVATGLLLGILAGTRPHTVVDQVVRVGSIFTYSLPTFVVGIFLLAFFYGRLQWFEPGRYNTLLTLTLDIPAGDLNGFLLLKSVATGNWTLAADLLRHLVLPVTTLAVVLSASLTQIVRANMIEQLRQEYVRTAWAKGLKGSAVVFKHTLRNALIPIVTVVGTLLFGLLSGVVITETVFNYPGVGNWAAQAAQINDTSGILGFALFSACAIAVINLVVDVLYGVIDPRVRYD